MKTLIFSTHPFEKPFIQEAFKLKKNQEFHFSKDHLSIQSAIQAKGYDAISLFTSDDASAKVLKKIKSYGIQYIALRSVGHDHIDLKSAAKLGIKVANVPEYSPYSIAEHTVALLLALDRKIPLGQELIKQNNFCLDSLVGFDLKGKTIGIIGTGRIGAAFARIMHGFGCKLLGFDIIQNDELMEQTDIIYTSLNKLCAQSDVISVHCPLTKFTKHLVNKKLFKSMKKKVIFINTARGSIVNTVDLIEAIENKTIAAAGLDVYEFEIPIFFINHLDKPIEDKLFKKLQSFPNVLITGHQAFLTNEALKGIAATTASNLDEFSKKGSSKNELF